MNAIVYSTDRIIQKAIPPIENKVSIKQWEAQERVSKARHATAKETLRNHYAIKAAACGMSLKGYCSRFGVNL